MNYQAKCSKLAAMDFATAEFHPDTGNHYLMSAFVLVHILQNAISNLELQRVFNVLRNNLVLQSACTLCNIRRRESSLTVNAIKKQLLSKWS